jgi:2-polyprenyl-3-methyl-5-hydroxy-6-metoxy-1,4-benzoquinol methylase
VTEERPFGRDWLTTAPASASYLNSKVVDLVRVTGATRVLDIGCGNGTLARQLADAGFKVVGVDWDPKAVSLAAERVPEGSFSVCRFTDEPPTTDFDLVVSTEVVEHLFDPNELLQFAFRALIPNGILIITTPYHGYLKNLAISLVNGWDKHFMVQVLAGHIKFFSRKTLTEALVRNGFEVASFKGAGRFPLLWKCMILIARKQ